MTNCFIIVKITATKIISFASRLNLLIKERIRVVQISYLKCVCNKIAKWLS